MKLHRIAPVILCGLFTAVSAQSRRATIDKLVKYGVITAKERPALQKQFKYAGHASHNVVILAGLEMLILQKKFHINLHKGGMYSYNFSYSNSKNQDSINTTLRLLLNKINKAGLLTGRVYNYTLKGVDSGRYQADVQMIGQMTEMTSRLEWLTPGRLMPVAEQLHKNDIISDSSFRRLENDIKNDKIESAFQLNEYCKLNKVFDLTKYPDDPDLWLEQLHRDIASIMPGLNFTNFSYTTIPDTSFSLPGVRFKVSLVCNGRTYKYKSVPYNTFRGGNGKISPKDLFVQDFYRIFNKVLTDQQSPLRLHSIMFSAGNATDDQFKHFALIAVTGRQAEIFMEKPCLSYMFLTMDNYDNTLTSARIDSAIAGWTKMGLFSHLSGSEINKAIDEAEADNLFSIGRLLTNFPGVTYPLDPALTGPDQSYKDLLNHLARITYGAFNPTKISQQKVNQGIKLSYSSNGRVHSFTFLTRYAWLDKKFPAFIKRLGEENNLPGKFYWLKYTNAIIYLTKQQHDYAVSHNLLDLGQE